MRFWERHFSFRLRLIWASSDEMVSLLLLEERVVTVRFID